MHTCAFSMDKIMELKFEFLHLPYLPDLSPSDCFYFQTWKNGTMDNGSHREVIAQTDAYFEDLPKSYFLDGFKKLEKRLENV